MKLSERLRFSDIRYDQWKRMQGVLSAAETRELHFREWTFRILSLVRQMAFLPLTLVRRVWDLVKVAAEFERLHFAPMRQVKQGRDCVVDHQTWLVNGHNIVLGDFVKVSAFSTIMAGERACVRIGTNTIIGPGVLVTSFNHGMALDGVPIRYQAWDDTPEASVTIGEDVWIGANVVILPGSRIGDGCVIGAGTIVKGTLPPKTIHYLGLKEITRAVPRRNADVS